MYLAGQRLSASLKSALLAAQRKDKLEFLQLEQLKHHLDNIPIGELVLCIFLLQFAKNRLEPFLRRQLSERR